MSAASGTPPGGPEPEARDPGAAGAFDAWHLPHGGPADTAADGALRRPLLSAEDVRRLAAALRQAREGLLDRPSHELADTLGAAGARFLDPSDPLRREALHRLPASAGVSPAMARAVVEGMARDWTSSRLRALLDAEFGRPSPLDAFVPAPGGRRVRALGPPLQLHVGAGTVPGVSATSLLRALLVRSAVLLKPGRGDAVLPVLLARALAEEDPGVSAAAAVAYWPGGGSDEGGRAAEDAALAAADLVVAYGGDDTLAALRSRLPAATRLVAYHHRVSVAVVGREALGTAGVAGTAAALARAVALFDQRGCVSPHQVWVERGGEMGPRELAQALAGELDSLHRSLPPGPPDPREASALHQLRGTAEMRAAAGEGVEVWSGGRAPWTVVLDPHPAFEPSCLNRVLRVAPVDDAAEVPALVRPVAAHLQTVGVAGIGGRRLTGLAEGLALAGASRIAPLSEAPWPPPWWHHDGGSPLRSLVRWVDLEGP